MKSTNLRMLLEKAVRLYTGTASGEIVPVMAVPVSEITKLMADCPPAKIGRPQVTANMIPDKFVKLYPRLLNKEINISEFAKICGISRPTVYKYIRLLQEEKEKQDDH